MVRILFFALHRKTLIAQYDVLEALYKRNNFLNLECDRVLNCAKNSQSLFQFLLTMFLSVGILIIIWPAIDYYLWSGALHTIHFHHIIGVNSSTPVGFTITMIYQSMATVYLNPIFTYFDGIFGIYVFNVWVFSGLIDHQIKQVNEILEDKKMSDTLCIKITFRNIIKMHCEMIEWVYNDCSKVQTFQIYLIFDMLSQICC